MTAAAGGVGITAVQIAKALGAKVIGAVGSDDKIDVIKKYGGADYGINYSKPGWQKDVLTITKGVGVDVVYDPVGLIKGGPELRNFFCCWLNDKVDCIKCTAWKGRLIVVGFAGGNIEKVSSVIKPDMI